MSGALGSGTLGLSEAGGELEVFTLVMGLAGGLALFLYGMEKMAEALKAVAGERMKTILARLTTNRFMGVTTGAFVTAVIQSSSVTTVLVVGFISAGLMSVAQSVGVIMGANIGTTITAQIVAFKVTKYALLLVAVGFGMVFSSRRERVRQYGSLLMGLGLVFFGMAVMGGAMQPLRSYEPFLLWMVQMESPLLGILAGAAFTALVQSSSATTGVVITMASQGLISLPAGIALSLGANIGTCITAMLASLGKPRDALRAAVVHVLFNLLGVLVWVGLVVHLADFVIMLSPSFPELLGADRLSAETPRQIANAHTVFNLVNTALFIGFATQFARVAQWLVPDRPLEVQGTVTPKYLDIELLATPALALDRARLEILHQGDGVKEMMGAILPAMLSGSREDVEAVALMDDAVDTIHGHIVTYLGKVSQRHLTEQQTGEFLRLLEAANDLENMGDIIETNLVRLGHHRLDAGITPSARTCEVIREFHGEVTRALEVSLQAVTQKDADAARAVIAMKAEINRLAGSAAAHEARRLVAEEPSRLPAYTLETDIIENLKRIFYFCKRMAREAGLPMEVDSH